VKYSFLLPLVQESLKSTKKHMERGSYGLKESGTFLCICTASGKKEVNSFLLIALTNVDVVS